ncbi:MAG: hypothetical protein RIQ54_490 [Candidatus Parcubacteria bacterium]|jgi:hypothetical protein
MSTDCFDIHSIVLHPLSCTYDTGCQNIVFSLNVSFSPCFWCRISSSPSAQCDNGLSDFSFNTIGLLSCIFVAYAPEISVQEIVMVKRFVSGVPSFLCDHFVLDLPPFSLENYCCPNIHVLVTAFDCAVHPGAFDIPDPIFSGPLFNLVSPYCYGRGYCVVPIEKNN